MKFSNIILHILRFSVECCGTEVMSFQEKLGQTVIHVLRASFGYFMMFCVVTMNIWLLISVVVGSAIGYGVGKPLVANHIRDSFTSHGYNTARVDIWNHGRNRSERSKSWRYQAIQSTNLSISRHGEDETCSEKQVLDRKHFEKGDNGPEIIWIRRSSEDQRSQENNASEVFDETEVQLRYPDNVSSIASEDRSPKSRFKSTSKVINASFRSSKSETLSSRSSVNSLVRNVKDNHVSRNSSRASTGRFKPVSQQIRRQISDLT